MSADAGEGPEGAFPTAADLRRAADFWESVRFFEADAAHELRRCGLTPRRYLVLLMASTAEHEDGAASVGAIASRLRLSTTTVSDLVIRAERAGLVERRRSDRDARMTLVRLTAEGERRLACGYRGLASAREELDRLLLAARRRFGDLPLSGGG
jgi:DNA-binding MarR family transcriptional regulator